MGASFRNVGEITELAGCDYHTIAPKLLEELKNSDAAVPKKFDAASAGATKQEKVTFVDDEAAFRWSLFNDQMAFEKLHEGIRGFAMVMRARGCSGGSPGVKRVVYTEVWMSLCMGYEVTCRRLRCLRGLRVHQALR